MKEADMINKLLKISYTIVGFVLVLSLSTLAVSAAEYLGPTPLKPQLSSNGSMLYNAVPAVVLRVDPNPPPEQERIPARFDMLTLPDTATATFSITYVPSGGTDPWSASCSTFPEGAKAAFNAAGAIWGNLLQSSVPITISACWSNLGSSSILGYSGGGSSYRNFTGAPLTNTWYSESLANALHGSDLGPGKFDMHITYNSNFSWYYGTDGQTPAGQYDLMSVVLHEIAHGLNFAGFMSYSGGTGSWGYGSGYPGIYDTFMKDGAGNLLIDTGTYTNPSTALGGALTSNNIWFHGSKAMAANGGQRVKMYAPSTWSSGSSYSHLDYDTFAGGVNRLMVFATSSGVSTHDPGPVTCGIFQDMGWPNVAAKTPVLAVSFARLGLWIYNSDSSWTQVSSANPENLIYSGSTLYVDFGATYGLYKWDGAAWTLLTSANPENMVTSGSTLYVDFGATYGLYKWDGAAWTLLTPANPENMVSSGSTLYVDFGATYGLYQWDGRSWFKLAAADPDKMAVPN
jgi:hypothetical protein